MAINELHAKRHGWLKNGNPTGDPSTAPRCGARTRKGTPCKGPALHNGRCRMHGGASTGPRTKRGLARSRRANWKQGRYSGKARLEAKLCFTSCCASAGNSAAILRHRSCEIWAPTQPPTTAQEDTAKQLGLPLDSVKVNVTLTGGAFGRRLFVDYVHEAVEISKAIGKPVQVVWTRSDDTCFGFFQPPSIVRITGALGKDGKPLLWMQRSVGCGLSMFGFPDEKELANPRHYFNDGSPWGSFDNPYNFPNLKADFVRRNSPVPSGPWRAVEYPAQVFARESFLDEMAHAGGRDPLDLRLELLHPGDILKVGDARIDRGRLIAVLKLVADKSNWHQPPASVPGRDCGRGLACNVYSDDCFIAQVAEVSVGRTIGDIRVHRVVCAIDAGA